VQPSPQPFTVNSSVSVVPNSTSEVVSQPLPIAESIVTKSSPKKQSVNTSTKSPESKPPESSSDATLRPHRSAKDKSCKDGPAKMRGLSTEIRDESELVRCYRMTIKKFDHQKGIEG
jgi:hypothetical protein